MSALLRRRRTLAILAAAAGTLTIAGPAFAHAIVSPPVAETKVLQQFTLSVPTEKEGATTTKIVLTVPDGFAVDSYEAEPGWTRAVKATGSGENAVVNTITWTGGKVPTEEDSVFRVNASIRSAKTLVFQVRQYYSDGTVVDWSGAEDSDTPAPTVRAVSDLGGGGSTDTLTIVALVLGAIAARRRRRRHLRGTAPARMTRRVRVGVIVWVLAAIGLVLPAVAGAHAALLRTSPSASVVTNGSPARVALTYSESIEPRFSIISVTDVNGTQVTTWLAGAPAGLAADAGRVAEDAAAGLVPRDLAGDLGRRAPGARGVHVRRRALAGTGAAVRDPVALRDGGHARARRAALHRVPLGDARGGAVRLPHADRAAPARGGARVEPAAR